MAGYTFTIILMAGYTFTVILMAGYTFKTGVVPYFYYGDREEHEKQHTHHVP